jgi:hypothetical protein
MQKFVFILSVGRSGTSIISNMLYNAGYYIAKPADILGADRFNKCGHFERKAVIKTNDRILKLAGGLWHLPPEEKDILNINIDSHIKTILKDYADHKKVVIKDPRLCLTFPLWEKHIDTTTTEIKIIHIIRNASEVAESLKARNGFDVQKSKRLWSIYNQRLIDYTEKHSSFIIHFDQLFSYEQKFALMELSEFLHEDTNLIQQIAKHVIDPKKRHYNTGENQSETGISNSIASVMAQN